MAQQQALKRSGRVEPFVAGRIALAASRALRDAGEDARVSRDGGLAVAEKVLSRAESIFGFGRPAPTEWIARAAREALVDMGWDHARWAWENHERERGKGPEPFERRAWKIGQGEQARELSWRQWEAALEQMSRALGHGWDGGLWARAALKAKPSLSHAEDWASFFLAWAQAARTAVAGPKKAAKVEAGADARDSSREALAAALRAQSACASELGVAPLMAGAPVCAKAAAERALARWKKAQKALGGAWPSEKELAELAASVDPASDAALSWDRQEELRRAMEREAALGAERRLPCELFADAALALFRRDPSPERGALMAAFLRAQSKGSIQLPARSLALALTARESFCPQWALDAGPSAPEAALSLARAAQLLSTGAAVALDLSGAPAAADGHGGPADWARALAGASRGVGAGPSRARAWLEPWHADFFEFLAAARGAEGRGASHGVWASDALAKRAIEGGDWALVDPKDFSRLGLAYGEEFAFWMDQAVEWVKEGKMAGQVFPAKEIWMAVAAAMSEGAPVALAFKEPLAGLRKKGERIVASASAHWALPAAPGEPIGSPEGTVDWGAVANEAEGWRASELLARALDNAIDAESGLAGSPSAHRLRAVSIGAARLPARARAEGETLALAAQKAGWAARDGSAKLARERGPFEGADKSHWSRPDPWADRAGRLREQRGGYWGQEDTHQAPAGGLPRNAALLALGDPEPGIARALEGELAEGDAPARLRAQLEWAALAQVGVDQGVAVELRLGALGPQEVAQALQLAWLRGVRSVVAAIGPQGTPSPLAQPKKKRKPRAKKASAAPKKGQKATGEAAEAGSESIAKNGGTDGKKSE
jgi:hypothetical protein